MLGALEDASSTTAVGVPMFVVLSADRCRILARRPDRISGANLFRRTNGLAISAGLRVGRGQKKEKDVDEGSQLLFHA